MTLTQEELKKYLTYNPATGIFLRKEKVAGYIDQATSYVKIMLLGKNYYAHRLAFLYMTGKFPSKHVDHVNKNKSDNTWNNLRDVPQAINNQNFIKATSRNNLGVLGVRQRGNSFSAAVSYNKIQVHAGSFATAEEAHQAYINLKRQLHVGNML